MWLNGRWIEMFDMKHDLYAEGDGNEGAGDGNTDKSGSGDVKPDFTQMFTEFSVNTNKTLTALTNEIKTLKKSGESTKALETKLAAIQTQLEAGKKLVDESDTEDGSVEKEVVDKLVKKEIDPAVAVMQNELKRLKEDNKKHQDAFTASEQRREAAELKQRQGERDRQLAEALTEAEAVSPKDAAKFLRGDAEWDEESGAWYFLDGEDKISIAAGVEKFLPKYMRQPATKRGGSGGRSTEMENTSTKAQLQQAAIDAGILAKKMRGADEYVSAANQTKRAAAEAGVDTSIIVRAIMQAPAA